MNNTVLSTITFYLDDDSTEGVDFIPATLTFTLQMIKIYYIKFHLKKIKLIVTVLVVDIDLLQRTFMVI